MSRRKTTVYIDEDLLKLAKIAAVRSGKKEYEVFEDALRAHLGLEAIRRIRARSDLAEEEAMGLATDEVHASRR